MKRSVSHFLLLLLLWMSCCSSDAEKALNQLEGEEVITDGMARVTNVAVSGQEGQYTFSVTIASPDLGCNQYADWWEVIDLDGNLLQRRILAHSHVNEQPFTRSGGSVGISENTEVYIRAHMNTTGYGSDIFKGSIANGFFSDTLNVAFAKDVEELAPLPTGCAF